MSQRLRPLTHSLRALEALPGPSNTSSRAARIISTRRALHASTVARSAQVAPTTTPSHSGNIYADETGRFYDQQERRAVFKARTAEEVASMKQHVDALLGLSFPPDLVQRMLTHASHIDAVNGHNQRLSFIGRRVLESYFLLFLHSSPAVRNSTSTSSSDESPEIDYADLTERVLNTYWFGEHIGTPWQLGRYMRWVSPEERAAQALLTQNAAEERGETPMRSRKPRSTQQQVGLYKIAGTTMEAVVGGVYHQFGAAAAHRLFHTRILPLMPNLPRAFAVHAKEICEKMGGPEAPLLVATDAKAGTKSSVQSSVKSELSSRPAFEAETPKSRTFSKAPASRERFPERMQREKLAL